VIVHHVIVHHVIVHPLARFEGVLEPLRLRREVSIDSQMYDYFDLFEPYVTPVIGVPTDILGIYVYRRRDSVDYYSS
jgi:hypothetical protein